MNKMNEVGVKGESMHWNEMNDQMKTNERSVTYNQ